MEFKMRLLLLTILSFSFLNAQSGILDITWPTPNKSHQKASNPYPSVLLSGIKNVHLPVYLTKSMAYDKNMKVVADDNFYSISFVLNGAMVVFEGDKTFQESLPTSNVEFQKIVQSASMVEYIEAEGIMTAEFNKHGVNYSINIECDNPKKDKRCKESSFIETLYNSLVMVGGQP